jgi:hypothetical protein
MSNFLNELKLINDACDSLTNLPFVGLPTIRHNVYIRDSDLPELSDELVRSNIPHEIEPHKVMVLMPNCVITILRKHQ